MSTDPSAGFRLTPQAVFGLLIIAVGVLLTAENLQWFDASRILQYWPLAVIVAGALKFAQSQTSSGRLFGALIVGIGMLLSAQWILRWNIDVEDWWLPLSLIVLGMVIILRARQTPMAPEPAVRRFPDRSSTETPDPSPEPALEGVTTRDAKISEFAVWAGKQRRNSSPVFRHADLTAIMGGIELDLRGASTANGEAVIDLFVMWGGIEIWVPPDWAVSNQVGLLMAGAEDKSTGTQNARHRLIVRGFAIMGGVEIKI
jgi:predicted membrane protein